MEYRERFENIKFKFKLIIITKIIIFSAILYATLNTLFSPESSQVILVTLLILIVASWFSGKNIYNSIKYRYLKYYRYLQSHLSKEELNIFITSLDDKQMTKYYRSENKRNEKR